MSGSINQSSRLSLGRITHYFYMLLISVGIPLFVSGAMILLANKQNPENKVTPVAENRTQAAAVSPTGKIRLTSNPDLKPTKKVPQIAGFLPSWTVASKTSVNLAELTQLIYFGLGVTENGELIKYKEDGAAVQEWSQFNSEHFDNIRSTAEANNTAILIALKNFDNDSIDQLISNRLASERLIGEVLELIREYQLDGVNIDFEYVSRTDFPTNKYFNRFLEMLVVALKEENPELTISVDLNATAVLKDPAYDMVKIGELADYVVLMAYDYYGPRSVRAGPVAPLEARGSDSSISKSYRSLKGRVPDDKIILAIPLYGYEWQTVNGNYNSPTVPNTGALATYGRVHDLLANRNDVSVYWDEISRSPRLVYRQSGAIKQIYYEDIRSLHEKMEFAQANNLGGLAVWALGYEGSYNEPWRVISEYGQ